MVSRMGRHLRRTALWAVLPMLPVFGALVQALRRAVVSYAAAAAAAACASFPSLRLAQPPAPAAGAAVVEPWTGLAFQPAELGLTLVPHACVRCMLGWCRIAVARAYAYALFVDDRALDAASLPAALAAKVAKPLGSTLKLQLIVNAKEIDGPHMAKGFLKSIQRRCAGGGRQFAPPSGTAWCDAVATRPALPPPHSLHGEHGVQWRVYLVGGSCTPFGAVFALPACAPHPQVERQLRRRVW
jgi:hypothetical protein